MATHHALRGATRRCEICAVEAALGGDGGGLGDRAAALDAAAVGGGAARAAGAGEDGETAAGDAATPETWGADGS